jgi:hypothetical protein
MARRVLNIAIAEMRLDRTRVVAIVGKLVAAGMGGACGRAPFMPRPAAVVARSIMREKPAADCGAPRREIKSRLPALQVSIYDTATESRAVVD